jgi:hypothetical protein
MNGISGKTPRFPSHEWPNNHHKNVQLPGSFQAVESCHQMSQLAASDSHRQLPVSQSSGGAGIHHNEVGQMRICTHAQTTSWRVFNSRQAPRVLNFFFFFSLALFAFWLRSSVVSVLFSLISETTLRSRIVIILIFVNRWTLLWACP